MNIIINTWKFCFTLRNERIKLMLVPTKTYRFQSINADNYFWLFARRLGVRNQQTKFTAAVLLSYYQMRSISFLNRKSKFSRLVSLCLITKIVYLFNYLFKLLILVLYIKLKAFNLLTSKAFRIEDVGKGRIFFFFQANLSHGNHELMN